MTPVQERDPVPPRKLLAAGGVKVRLAAGSALLLVVGVLLAPRAVPTALSPPQERAAPLLEEQVQLRDAVRPFEGVQEVAARVRDHAVAVVVDDRHGTAIQDDFSTAAAPPRAAGFGVFVSDTHVLTHEVALDGRSAVELAAADGQRIAARVAAYEPSSGLALLQTEGPATGPVAMASDAPAAGALAVAVGRWEGRDIAVPVFVTSVESDRYRIGAIDGSILPGMPVYTLDGALLALAAGDGRDGHAFPVGDAAARLMSRAAAGDNPASVGIALQELAGPLVRAFGEGGVLVSEVVPGGPADVAGVQAGDVLLGVGDAAVDAVDAATRRLGSTPVDTETALRVRRAGRVRVLTVTPAPAYEVAALARRRVRDAAAGLEARALFPEPVLDRAGIPAAARVLDVNGRAVASQVQAQRELRRSRQPVVLSLVHGNRRFFAAVDPTP